MHMTLSILLALPLLAGTVYWSLAFLRTRQILRTRPTIRRGLELEMPSSGEPDVPIVSIIVPAHNEARVIRDCARSLLNQSVSAIEFIFVLDRCSDETLALLREEVGDDSRVRIIENGSCPADWAGKCNAATCGARIARGEWLLFTDADVIFDRDLIRAAVALAADRKLALLSLLSTLTARLPFERFLQPMASFHLLRMFPIDRVNRTSRGRPFANGQFLLFHRAVYERIGGHQRVHGDLLEDIAFARVINAEGERLGLALADNMLKVSMYDTYATFRRGWSRIFIEACRRRPRRLFWLGVRTVVSGVMLPVLQVVGFGIAIAMFLTGHMTPGLILGLAAITSATANMLTLGTFYSQGRTPLSGLPLHPIGSAAVAGIMFRAARDLRRGIPVRWGGKEYILSPPRRTKVAAVNEVS